MIMGTDMLYVIETLSKLLKVVPYTIFIMIVSGTLGLLLAIIVTAIRIKKIKIWNPLMGIYISFFRSTPCIIHLFLVYYGLPIVLELVGIDISWWSKTIFATVALVLFNGAYVSEILRPAYLSVDKGQHEAAESVGLTGFKKFYRIICPQAVPIALPSLGNAVIDLIKDTSVLFIIGLVDIMGKAKLIIASDYGVKKLEVYIAVGIIYWMITFISNIGMKSLEKKYKLVEGQQH